MKKMPLHLYCDGYKNMLEFKIKNTEAATGWCIKHISPCVYYLHNAYGGQGWKIMRKYADMVLCIEDDKKAVLALLIVGE